MSGKVRIRAEVAASVLPDVALRWLGRHVPVVKDPTDGWNLWWSASYRKWARKDEYRSKVSKHAIIRAACALLWLAGMVVIDLLGLAWEKIRGRDWR